MEKFYTNISGNKEINILDLNDSEGLLGNAKFTYEYKRLDNNIILIRVNSKNFIVEYDNNEEEKENNEFTFSINSKKISVVTKNELDVLTEKISGGKKDSKLKNEVHSPMPGVILKVNIKEGDVIKKGDVILVLEAMKMENEIKAARDSKIKKINVTEKQSVNKNDLLIILE